MKNIPNHSEEARMKSPTSQLWSKAQKSAFIELCEVAQLALFGDYFSAPIQPRLTKLVIGPSGIGKSHLIRAVSAEIGVPCMRVTFSNWAVNAVKDLTPTMAHIHEFISNNERSIIHIDELDKARMGSTWDNCCMGEVFDLLDRTPSQPSKNLEWTRDLLLRLRRDCWVVGSGTWAHLWAQAGKPKVGFREKEDNASLVANVRRAVRTSETVPEELLKRFCSEAIILEPADAEDFRQAAESLGLTKLATELRMPLDYEEAVQSQLGARWLEESMGQLLLQARRYDRTDLIPHRSFEPDTTPSFDDDSEPEIDSSPL
jgi:SpoVK/Ycf46/Vps4 family AAA+-type ATPase